MTIEHTTIYHCQECGRVVCQARGEAVPTCCGEAMVCAIADLARETAEPATVSPAPCSHLKSIGRHRDAQACIPEEAGREHSSI